MSLHGFVKFPVFYTGFIEFPRKSSRNAEFLRTPEFVRKGRNFWYDHFCSGSAMGTLIKLSRLIFLMGLFCLSQTSLAEVKRCESLLMSDESVPESSLLSKLLQGRGYAPSVAHRIATGRSALALQILARPFEGRAALVSRGLCVSPTDFDPAFRPVWGTNEFPYRSQIYVSASGFSDARPYRMFSCPGGISIELQIPRFYFSGMGSISFARRHYREGEGGWGYIYWDQIPDLSIFIHRVEVHSLEENGPTLRMSYDEFINDQQRLRNSNIRLTADAERQWHSSKRSRL